MTVCKYMAAPKKVFHAPCERRGGRCVDAVRAGQAQVVLSHRRAAAVERDQQRADRIVPREVLQREHLQGKKAGLFLGYFSLCLSRACLGKYSVLKHKAAPKKTFGYSPQNILERRPRHLNLRDTALFFNFWGPFFALFLNFSWHACPEPVLAKVFGF